MRNSCLDEVKTDLERIKAMRDRRSRQAARSQVERDVPGMIDPWREREANLADDLRPHVKGFGGGLPFGERQSWPKLIALLLGQGSEVRVSVFILFPATLRHGQNSCDRQRASLYQTLAARVGTEVAKRGGL